MSVQPPVDTEAPTNRPPCHPSGRPTCLNAQPAPPRCPLDAAGRLIVHLHGRQSVGRAVARQERAHAQRGHGFAVHHLRIRWQ
eukprot:scaffold27974_cov26-Tisochrysis_lutea.AAC.1